MESIEQARLWLEQGRADRAEQALRSALAENPQDPQAFAILALCLCDLNREAEAGEMAQQAIALAPDWYLGHYALAVSYLNRGRTKEARQSIDEAMRLEPNDPDFWRIRAQIHMVGRQWSEAADAARRGLALDPEHVNCSNVLTSALSYLGDTSASMESIRNTLARDPENAQTHIVAGWVSLQSGDMESAGKHFTEALRISPNAESARDGLLEVIKAKNVIYRTMLKFFMWMGRQSKQTLWFVIIGLWLVPKGLRAVAEKNPALAPLLYPIIFAMLGFIYLTWVIDPIFDAILFLHPLGRHALDPSDRKRAIVVVTTLGLALLCVSAGLAGQTWAFLFGVVLLLFVIPIKVAFHSAQRRRKLVFGITIALGILGFSAAALLTPTASMSSSIGATLDGQATKLAGTMFAGYAIGVMLLSFISTRWSLDPRSD